MSSYRRCYFLRALNFNSKLERPNEGISSRVKFFKRILHESATPSPLHTWLCHLKSSPSSPRTFPPPPYSSYRLIFVAPPPVPDASSFTPRVPPSPSLYWFTNVCSGTLLSFILKTLRLPRNCYLCWACTARAMSTVENISCNSSRSSGEGHRSSAPKAA